MKKIKMKKLGFGFGGEIVRSKQAMDQKIVLD